MTCITEGDQYPFIWAINYPLTGSSGASMDIRSKVNGALTQRVPLTVSNPAEGECTWDMDGTLPAGVYEVIVEVEFADGRVIHSPSCGNYRLEVKPDL